MKQFKRSILLLVLVIGFSGCMPDEGSPDTQTTDETVLSSIQSVESEEATTSQASESSAPETTTQISKETTESTEALVSDTLTETIHSSETESEPPTLPIGSAGTQENPLTVGDQATLTIESQFGEADLTLSVDTMVRGQVARDRAAEENQYNIFEDNQDAVFMDITITVNNLDHIGDAPLLVFGELHFGSYRSKNEPYEEDVVLSYDDEFFNYFYEGDTETAVVAKKIPRDEAAYIVFYDLLWIEVPLE